MNVSGFMLAQGVAQGFDADEPLQPGVIVGFKEDSPSSIESINVDQVERMLGVVIDPNETPITLSGEDGQVFVATTGIAEVFVSDQNGEIKSGDYVTASSIGGIGMLATTEQSNILGVAVDGFNGRDSRITKGSLQDTSGNTIEVNIGRIKVNIDVKGNPIARSAAVTPEWLGRVGQAIAGKSLSPARIYISAGLFLIGAFISGAILYAGIRSSIIAIGRNPLSKKSILRGLLQVIFTSLIVFIISVGGVYLLLRV